MKTPAVLTAATLALIAILSTALIMTGHSVDELLPGLVLILPAIAAMFITANTGRKIDVVQKQANGSLTAKDALIQQLLAAFDPHTALTILNANPTAVNVETVTPEPALNPVDLNGAEVLDPTLYTGPQTPENHV